MKNNELEQVYALLKSINRTDLITNLMMRKSLKEIEKVLNMPYWQDKKYQMLLSQNIWHSNPVEIEKILTELSKKVTELSPSHLIWLPVFHVLTALFL